MPRKGGLPRIALTPAQVSALQCSWLFEDVGDTSTPGEDILRLSLQNNGLVLVVSATTQEAIVATLTDLANSEDALAGNSAGPESFLATRAARSLTALASKVRRIVFKEVL